MKVYIFLANTLGGISGCPIYIRNKSRYLKSLGWDIVAFDNYADKQDVYMPELQTYANNRYSELQFPPSWYSNSHRKNVIKKVMSSIPETDNPLFVIESTQIVLGLWGEYLASQLGCKHILFNINEDNVVTNKGLFDFLNKKRLRGELFSISPKAVSNLFKNFLVIDEPQNYYWNACVKNDVVEMDVPKLRTCHENDFNIGYFGRHKRFLPYVIKQVISFAKKHPDQRIGFILLGVQEKEVDCHLLPVNLSILFLGRMSPIPKSFFEIAKVVIATAGCASISFGYAQAVISMSVLEDDRPIGILGRTTISSSYPSDEDNDIKSLSEYLETIYSGAFRSLPIRKMQSATKGYDYQLNFIEPVEKSLEVTGIKCILSRKQAVEYALVKLGFSHFVSYIKAIIN